MALFGKKKKYTLINVKKKNIPEGIFSKCPECESPTYVKGLQDNMNVCPSCGYHFGLTAEERIKLTMDEGTFVELDRHMESADPLKFKGPKTYKEKLGSDKKRTGLIDAIITGEGKIQGKPASIAVTDSRFIMGSMGAVVGEKITRAIERATEKRLPVIIISGS